MELKRGPNHWPSASKVHSNCTNMELKPWFMLGNGDRLTYSNCTNMELKQSLRFTIKHTKEYSNCTNMELKLEHIPT